MHTHYFTLKRQAAELDAWLKGAVVLESFTARKNEWLLSLALPQGQDQTLALGCDPQVPYFLVRDLLRRGRNMAPVMPAVVGLSIAGIAIEPGERLIVVQFSETARTLHCRYFGLHSNFYLVEQEGTVLDAFKKSRQWIGKRLESRDSERLDPTDLSLEVFLELVAESEDSIEGLLKKRFRYFTRTVLDELFARVSIHPGAPGAHCSRGELTGLYREIQRLFHQFKEGEPCVYFQRKRPVKFTLGAFYSLSPYRKKTFSTLNEALRVFCFQALRWRWITERKKQLQQAVEKHRRRILKRLETIERSGHDGRKSERFRQLGELLLSQPESFRQGACEVVVVDYFNPEMPEVRLPVNPALTLQENAEQYFKKSRELRQRSQQREEENRQLRKELQFLEEAASALSQAEDRKTLAAWEQRLRDRHLLQNTGEKGPSGRLPYRVYEKEGYQIWVGRSATENDTLTFRLAHKEDWWLHVQGYRGSHVIVRNPRRLEAPPEPILHFAARLAVTHSAAKHARYVPVLWTKVRYVRKPRKSPPGTVVAERTRTMFVDPLPTGTGWSGFMDDKK